MPRKKALDALPEIDLVLEQQESVAFVSRRNFRK
jgi:hypothetical protein